MRRTLAGALWILWKRRQLRALENEKDAHRRALNALEEERSLLLAHDSGSGGLTLA